MITPQDRGPIFEQIAETICDRVLSGALPEGERVPSVRELGGELGVNPNTCARSYEILEQASIIEMRRGIGYFVVPGARQTILSKRRDYFFTTVLPSVKKQIETLEIPIDKITNFLIR